MSQGTINTYIHEGETLHIRTRIGNRRQKNLRLIIKPCGEILLSTPPQVSKRVRERFVGERLAWLVTKQRELAKHAAAKPQYHHGSEHWLLGSPYPLVIDKQPHRSHQFSERVIILRLPNPNNERVAAQLNAFYRDEAQRYFAERLHAVMPLTPWVNKAPELRVRRMKRQWGNCAAKGHITLNQHLIKAPPECIDQVIIHELCHLKHFNHSAAFYGLMDQAMPDWRNHRQHLRTLAPHLLPV
ncbi:M48 family metallopeptidase [Suttonella sp. R2A3]|uniref:M48 family metallopeptidase n=1 Tax=Suttonella sp. R2A3 TaxID=2908648 RepID=UPI001F4550DD|nr:SprT family zinc-dependent metalloprotease [Suttonella sp. R2A3]UJF23732.1 M48 family metallopeptidase [Suttonella sp. R2A3]